SSFISACQSLKLQATDNEQSFDAPKIANCSWTVMGDAVNFIQIRLNQTALQIIAFLQTAGGDQCVQVIDDLDPSQTSNVICAQSGSPMFQSTGPSVSVTYPGKKMRVYVDPFKVFYLSSPTIKCDTTQLTAALEEQYYVVYAENKTIPSTFGCTRTVSNEQGGQMQIYLKLFNVSLLSRAPCRTSNADQCVQVTDALDSSQAAQVICAQSGQEFYQSTGSSVSVTYPGKETSTQVESFQVYFMLTPTPPTICDTTQLIAGANELYYDISPQPGLIPTDFQCSRTIVANPGQAIQVYLKVLETSNSEQCVQVTDALDSSQTAQVICAQSGQEFYQSTGSSVSVTYPGKEMSTQVDSFQVFYILGVSEICSCHFFEFLIYFSP
ncbi:hypothetical protein FGIG_10599, partial [Fasciola gigantica]